MNREELSRSMGAVRRLFGAAACSCALVDEDGAALRFVAADGAGAARILDVLLPVGRGLVGWAASSGQPLAVRDVGQDARFARDVAESTDFVPTSVLAAPFFDREGEVLGVVEVLDPSVEVGSDWSLAVLGTLATLVGEVVLATSDGGEGPVDRLAELGRTVLRLVEGHRR